jgi:hypothetical protein
MCVLNQGAHIYFSKKNILEKIRMSLVLEYNWHETAKHMLLTLENSLKYIAHDSWVLLCPISNVIHVLRKY